MTDECVMTVGTDPRGGATVLKIQDAGGRRFECVLERADAEDLARHLDDAVRHVAAGGRERDAMSVNARECGLGVRVDGGVPHVFVVDIKNAKAATSLPVGVDQAKRTAAALRQAAAEAKAKHRG